VRQDAQARLPDAEEIAQDAAAAEEMLAELQASTELVDSVGAVAQGGGMSAEEQEMYDELEKELHPAKPAPLQEPAQVPQVSPAEKFTSAPVKVPADEPAAAAPVDRPKRAEPEAG